MPSAVSTLGSGRSFGELVVENGLNRFDTARDGIVAGLHLGKGHGGGVVGHGCVSTIGFWKAFHHEFLYTAHRPETPTGDIPEKCDGGSCIC